MPWLQRQCVWGVCTKLVSAIQLLHICHEWRPACNLSDDMQGKFRVLMSSRSLSRTIVSHFCQCMHAALLALQVGLPQATEGYKMTAWCAKNMQNLYDVPAGCLR